MALQITLSVRTGENRSKPTNHNEARFEIKSNLMIQSGRLGIVTTAPTLTRVEAWQASIAAPTTNTRVLPETARSRAAPVVSWRRPRRAWLERVDLSEISAGMGFFCISGIEMQPLCSFASQFRGKWFFFTQNDVTSVVIDESRLSLGNDNFTCRKAHWSRGDVYQTEAELRRGWSVSDY